MWGPQAQLATVTPGGTAATGWNFYTTAAPLSNVTGTKAFCAADDGVVRTEPAGTIVAPAGYAACLALTPMNN